ncbi:hypothetical protein BGX34_009620 [Mortierella sp. NVP85]|nr:hypothetical protein BGX34_009620 [Mortierella sp. NVP85]
MNVLPSMNTIVSPPKAFRILASEVYRGENLRELLQSITTEMDRGIPNGWEQLAQPPVTQGTSGAETMEPQNLDQVMSPWGLHPSVYDTAFEDIQALIHVAMDKAFYVAQHFTYGLPHCFGSYGGDSNIHVYDDVLRPACLSTLLVVAKPKIIRGDRVWTTELVHVYMQSEAQIIEQKESYEDCHFCWFSRCCHTKWRPRGLRLDETERIQQLLSTSQADWARAHIPSRGYAAGPIPLSPSSSGLALFPPEEFGPCNDNYVKNANWPIQNIDRLLRQFIQNKAENEEVFKKQDVGFLKAFQNDMRTRQQDIKKMLVTVNEHAVVPFLEDMVSDCFERSGVEESVRDWFKRVWEENRSQGKPISLECSVASQRKEEMVPPHQGCNSSTTVTSKALFTWVILSPQNNMIDTLIIRSNLDVNHLECVPLTPPEGPGEPGDDQGCRGRRRRPHFHLAPFGEIEESTGAIIRWSVMQPDGSFNPVHYMKEWLDYPTSVNKALLDILRFSAAASYLRVNIPSLMIDEDIGNGYNTQEGLVVVNKGVDNFLDPASMAALGKAMTSFADGWSAIAKAFKSSVREQVMRRVCLGFEKYNQFTKASAMSGVHPGHMLEVVEQIIVSAQLPDNRDLKSIMLGIKYSDEFAWIGESITYTAPNGKSNFFYLTKHTNPNTNKTDLVYGSLNTEFTLAPDMLIVNRQTSILGGIWEKEETIFRTIPHELTLNETALMEMYFEIIVFRKMAQVTGIPLPPLPDLTPLCPN